MNEIINIIIMFIYLMIFFFISKEDRINNKIDKRAIVFGSIFSIIYMVYQIILDKSYVYISSIYIIIFILLFAIDTFLLRKYAKESYIVSLLTVLNIILIFTGIDILIKTVLVAIFALILYVMLNKVVKKKNIQIEKEPVLPVAFFLCASHVLTILVEIIL